MHLADEGDYQCQVLSRDPAQSIRSKAARLEVRAPCSRPIITGPAFIESKRGDVLLLQCTCSGARPQARLQWKIGSESLGPGNTSSVKETTGLTWSTSSVLEFEVGDQHDGLEATCSVAGTSVDNWAKVNLGVTYPPIVEVVGAEEEDNLQVGGKAVLLCQARARPEVATWGWRLAGQEVEGETNRLVIERLTPDLHGAEVVCLAENKMGRVNGTARLFLHGEDFFVLYPHLISCTLPSSSESVCSTNQHPRQNQGKSDNVVPGNGEAST